MIKGLNLRQIKGGCIMKIIVACLLVITFVTATFTGCATTDSRRTKAEGTATGAGIGAVIGGVVGYLIGGKDGAKLLAAMGAATGAAVGYGYGTHVAAEKEKYAKEEDWLDACIASVEKVNQETREYNLRLAGQIKKLETEIMEIRAKYKQGAKKKLVFKAEKNTLDKTKAEAEERLKRARFELENQEKVLSDAKKNSKAGYMAKLDEHIGELKELITELEGQTEALASMSQRMSV
jgi:uncharacterized protein YcfJ